MSLGRSPAKPPWGSSPLAAVQGAVALCGALQRFSFGRGFLQPLMHPRARRAAEPHGLLPALPCCHPGEAAGCSHAPAAQHCVPQLPCRGRRGARGTVGCVAISVVQLHKGGKPQPGSRCRVVQGRLEVCLGPSRRPPIRGRAAWRGAACAALHRCSVAATRSPWCDAGEVLFWPLEISVSLRFREVLLRICLYSLLTGKRVMHVPVLLGCSTSWGVHSCLPLSSLDNPDRE